MKTTKTIVDDIQINVLTHSDYEIQISSNEKGDIEIKLMDSYFNLEDFDLRLTKHEALTLARLLLAYAESIQE